MVCKPQPERQRSEYTGWEMSPSTMASLRKNVVGDKVKMRDWWIWNYAVILLCSWRPSEMFDDDDFQRRLSASKLGFRPAHWRTFAELCCCVVSTGCFLGLLSCRASASVSWYHMWALTYGQINHSGFLVSHRKRKRTYVLFLFFLIRVWNVPYKKKNLPCLARVQLITHNSINHRHVLSQRKLIRHFAISWFIPFWN